MKIKISKIIMIVLFMLTAIGMIIHGIESLAFAKYLYRNVDTQVSEGISISRLNNPNPYNRDYIITNDPSEMMGDIVQGNESKLMEIYEELGIQVYVVNYLMDHNHRASKKEVRDEAYEYIISNGIDPYGIYHITAEYNHTDSNGDYISCDKCWDTSVDGYIVYGEEVDKWWTLDIQKYYEEVSNYTLGYISDLYIIDYIDVLSHMISNQNELDDLRTFYVESDKEWAREEFLKGIVFIAIPAVTLILFVFLQVSRAKSERAKRTKDILETPIATLVADEVEEIKNKYNEEK